MGAGLDKWDIDHAAGVFVGVVDAVLAPVMVREVLPRSPPA